MCPKWHPRSLNSRPYAMRLPNMGQDGTKTFVQNLQHQPLNQHGAAGQWAPAPRIVIGLSKRFKDLVPMVSRSKLRDSAEPWTQTTIGTKQTNWNLRRNGVEKSWTYYMILNVNCFWVALLVSLLRLHILELVAAVRTPRKLPSGDGSRSRKTCECFLWSSSET